MNARGASSGFALKVEAVRAGGSARAVPPEDAPRSQKHARFRNAGPGSVRDRGRQIRHGLGLARVGGQPSHDFFSKRHGKTPALLRRSSPMYDIEHSEGRIRTSSSALDEAGGLNVPGQRSKACLATGIRAHPRPKRAFREAPMSKPRGSG